MKYKERKEKERAAYEKKIVKVAEIKRYNVDESGIHKFLFREYGYGLRGEKVYGEVSGKRYERVNIVAAKCVENIIERHEYGCSIISVNKIE